MVVDAAVVSVIAVVGVVDGLVVGSGDGGSSFKNKNKTEVISQLNINDMSCIYHTFMIFKVQVLRKKILFYLDKFNSKKVSLHSPWVISLRSY